jgi:D-alanyl-lipoteichoic acid acyltransferase DltB (MBOAT superfamily)
MLFSFPGFGSIHFFSLISVTLWTFLVGSILQGVVGTLNGVKKGRILLAFLGILSVIFFLAVFKYPFLNNLFFRDGFFPRLKTPGPIFFIGISYFSFKMMHFLVECYKRQISKLSLIDYFNYILFFPAFISGPINRYNHFCEQFNQQAKKSLKRDLINGGERIIHGLFKKFALVTLIYPYILISLKKPAGQLTAFEIAFGIYAYAFYFYFDFSGYSDMAIGSARLMGIELPENFNNPFLKRNIQQLWANWHISLTRWLSDYIYWPIVRKLRNIETFRKRHLLLSSISILITFIVCGMWHGETANFIIWGFYHGVGIACMNLYQSHKKKIKNKFLRRYFISKYSRTFGVIATFHFFVFGLLFFVFDLENIKILALRFLKFVF